MSKASNSSKQDQKTTGIVQDMLGFISRSPTPFHATRNLRSMFEEAGFQRLSEGDEWECSPGNSYVVTRNDSSIVAFTIAPTASSEDTSGSALDKGIRMIGAHTDSPCLRIKPNPEINRHGVCQLGIEVYGGVLLHPWMDRDLSIAGRVSGITKEGELFNEIIDLQTPVAIIPNLAIHLDRSANKDKTVNPQNHLPTVIGISMEGDEHRSFKELLVDYCTADAERILDFELSCYDTQPPAVIGMKKEFVASARLDNLLSSYVGARALIDSDNQGNGLFVSTDHEEVGSASACGAQGPFLRSVLERLIVGLHAEPGAASQLTRIIDNSMMLSCDNAHAIHPNYPDKHDQNHGPLLNRGPVIKVNSNQRYASNSVSSARFQRICETAGVPVQHFVTRSDMACGSTIGPITASELGIETLDIGVPQWAMHSIRESAGSTDIEYLYTALLAYLR